ncbi:MAG: hypothetical protein ACYC5K_09590, partial [Saccharofermentanales bacterium]
LTPAGGNVFPDKYYGEMNASEQFNFKPAFVDLAVDRNGIIYAAEMVTGMIYVYDGDGNNLSVFGGTGKTMGHFELISSVAVNSKGDLFVLDSVNNVIQVLQPTELMNNIIKATTLYNYGDYDGAGQPWDNVLKMDSTNYLANMGFAKSAYMERDYREAMKLYKNSLDPQGYSNAFYFYRLGIFRNYFFPIVFAGIVLMMLLVLAFKLIKKRADRLFDEGVVLQGSFSPAGHLDIGILTFFHPIEGFMMIKRNRSKLKLWTPAILFIAFVTVRLVFVYTVHFPLSDVSAIYSDFLKQAGFLAFPLLSVVLVGYILTSLSDGKQTFTEMATASMYSFLPYIILTLPISLVSQLMCLSENGLFGALNAGVWIWSISLLLISVKTMNQYTFGKLIWTIFKILFGVISFWMICALLYIVFFQSVSLVSGIYEEFVTGIYN